MTARESQPRNKLVLRIIPMRLGMLCKLLTHKWLSKNYSSVAKDIGHNHCYEHGLHGLFSNKYAWISWQQSGGNEKFAGKRLDAITSSVEKCSSVHVKLNNNPNTLSVEIVSF